MKKFKDPLKPKGKKAEVKSTPRKNRPQDYALTYSDTTGKDGLIKTGMFAGCPSWVAFYIAERKPWSREDSDETFAVRPEDSKAFPVLKDVGSVIIRTHDERKQHKGFRFEVVSATGPAVIEEAQVDADRSGLESMEEPVPQPEELPKGESLASAYFKKRKA